MFFCHVRSYYDRRVVILVFVLCVFLTILCARAVLIGQLNHKIFELPASSLLYGRHNGKPGEQLTVEQSLQRVGEFDVVKIRNTPIHIRIGDIDLAMASGLGTDHADIMTEFPLPNAGSSALGTLLCQPRIVHVLPSTSAILVVSRHRIMSQRGQEVQQDQLLLVNLNLEDYATYLRAMSKLNYNYGVRSSSGDVVRPDERNCCSFRDSFCLVFFWLMTMTPLALQFQRYHPEPYEQEVKGDGNKPNYKKSVAIVKVLRLFYFHFCRFAMSKCGSHRTGLVK